MENGPSAHLVGDEPTASGRPGQPTVDSQAWERNEGIDGLVLKRLTRLADHRASLVPFLDATPGLLAIPPGVWHADQNWGDTDARVLNFPTHPYDPDDPDNFRIDPHSDVIPFDWKLRDA